MHFGDSQKLNKSLDSKELADQTSIDAIDLNGVITETWSSARRHRHRLMDGTGIRYTIVQHVRLRQLNHLLGRPFQVADGPAVLPPGFKLAASQRRGGEVKMDVAAVGDVIAEVPQLQTAEGVGPDLSGDQYTRIMENPFIKAEARTPSRRSRSTSTRPLTRTCGNS